MPDPIFIKLGMYIMAPEPTATVYFMNPSHQSVYLPVAARQQLCKNVTMATNTCTTIELLDVLFSMWSVLFQRKVGHLFFPEHLVQKSDRD
jgi:hypothetical protein